MNENNHLMNVLLIAKEIFCRNVLVQIFCTFAQITQFSEDKEGKNVLTWRNVLSLIDLFVRQRTLYAVNIFVVYHSG